MCASECSPPAGTGKCCVDRIKHKEWLLTLPPPPVSLTHSSCLSLSLSEFWLHLSSLSLYPFHPPLSPLSPQLSHSLCLCVLLSVLRLYFLSLCIFYPLSFCIFAPPPRPFSLTRMPCTYRYKHRQPHRYLPPPLTHLPVQKVRSSRAVSKSRQIRRLEPQQVPRWVP